MQYMNIIFVCNEELKGGHTKLFTLFNWQQTKSSNCSRSGVNVRAHLLRNNYSRNFSLIRHGPLSSLSVVSRNPQRIACSFNRSGSETGLGVGFSEDTRSLSTELSESCWSFSGEAKSGFPANFFSRNRTYLFLKVERGNADGDLFFFQRRLLTGFFAVVRPVTPLSSLALLGVFARSLQLTIRIHPDST